MPETAIKVVGVMSGTSLDGLDLALCKFETDSKSTNYQIIAAKCIPYSAQQRKVLDSLINASALDLSQESVNLGIFIGESINLFLADHNEDAQLISSHGHTVFHNPADSLTLQIGSLPHIAAITNLPVVGDFRTLDIALGGQGAPLVPIGDEMLFSQYHACLNLGGIANISADYNGKRVAYDICPFNMMLNFFAQKRGLEFDDCGNLAAQGKVDETSLLAVNNWEFYHKPGPKSLGKELVMNQFLLIGNLEKLSVEDALATLTQHFAMQVGIAVKNISFSGDDVSVLVTGGGAYNQHFIEKLRAQLPDNYNITIPDDTLIQYKEALVFAYLGWLRYYEKENVLSSVTGSKKNHVGGALYLRPNL